MGSKRYPGKVIQPFLGKTVIEHVIDRAMLVPGVDLVILALPLVTESQKILDTIESYSKDKKFAVHLEANEDDVLERYYQAALAHGITVVERITGDCPLHNPYIDWAVIDNLIEKSLDYCSNVYPTRTFPKGIDCEAFTFECLEAARMDATSAYDREHVTPWMQRQDDAVLLKGLVMNKKDFSEMNLCIDEPGDIERVEKIISEVDPEEVFDDVEGK
jgi:spore coat polysaccharide biosynthesis protein SpsF (cytidylyltransferase family)